LLVLNKKKSHYKLGFHLLKTVFIIIKKCINMVNKSFMLLTKTILQLNLHLFKVCIKDLIYKERVCIELNLKFHLIKIDL